MGRSDPRNLPEFLERKVRSVGSTVLELMQSDTFSVSVGVSPQYAWSVLSQIENWPKFSPFALSVRRTSDTSWKVMSPQGEIPLRSQFDARRLLLDHEVFTGGQWVLIPYRVVPNLEGCELVMTNFKSPGDSDRSYEEQNEWVVRELQGARRFLEERHLRGEC